MPFTVIENTPGYLPDAEPLVFEDYGAAVEHAHEMANELEDQGYTCDRSWASADNYLAIRCVLPDTETVAPDLGRFIAVEQVED